MFKKEYSGKGEEKDVKKNNANWSVQKNIS